MLLFRQLEMKIWYGVLQQEADPHGDMFGDSMQAIFCMLDGAYSRSSINNATFQS